MSAVLKHLTLCLVSIAAAGALGATDPAAAPADLVLLDGKVLTVDERFSTATALAVRDGRFVAIGSNDEIRRHIGQATRVIDGARTNRYPGLIDTHVHALGVAEAEAAQPFRNLTSIGEVQAWIRAEAARRPAGHVAVDAAHLSRRGCANSDSRRGRSSTRRRRDIRSSSTARMRSSLNTAALRAAGITRDSPDPRAARSSKTRPASRPGCCGTPAACSRASIRRRRQRSARHARKGAPAVPGRGHHQRDRARRDHRRAIEVYKALKGRRASASQGHRHDTHPAR